MTYPTSPKFNAINLQSESPTLFSESVNGRQQSRKIGGQKWTFTATYPLMTRTEFNPVFAYAVALKGRHGVFTVAPTEISTTSGTASGTVSTSAAIKGALSVTISGLTGALKAGDVVKFSGHSKVYMLTADRSGNGAMAITPALVEAVGTETVTYNDVPFTVRLANDVQGYQFGAGNFFKYEVDFIEALS
jgi:hypothetical protein|tara:strand:+ start:1582 stop:2151 length:570 start_codon:yes stop_codon:yes gene_type:complete